MGVFRVQRNRGYTVMSNYHLRDKRLSLKAKGLLTQMLSLPEDWDYTLRGLSSINKESIDAIRTAVWELESAGYIVRSQTRDKAGRMGRIEYTIYETPQKAGGKGGEEPGLENPTTEDPPSGNAMQSSTDPMYRELSHREGPDPIHPGNGDTDRIKSRIEFEALVKRYPHDRDVLEEIVSLIAEIESSDKERVRIAGDDFPSKLVRERYRMLDSGHIEYVLECLHRTTTRIRNIKQYMLAVLFNAPATIGSYYTTQVSSDLRRPL